MIASEANANRLFVRLLEAQERGYPVLVTYPEGASFAVDAARRLGAEVVDPEPKFPDSEALRRSLIAAARERGYPGLIFHERVGEPINFDRTESSLRETTTYAIDSSTASPARQNLTGDCLVAIPAFNEAESIMSVVEEVGAYADAVLVVDDGSSDRTAALAAEAGAIVVQHEENRGYGAALKTAFREAKLHAADHLVVLDGDGQHDVTDVPELVSTQRRTDAEIVVGSRYNGDLSRGIPLYRRFGLVLINWLISTTLLLLRADISIDDAQSGFRAYDSRAVASLATDETISDGMAASVDILFHAYRHGYDITEVGTEITYEVEAASTHEPLPHGIQLVKQVLQTLQRERPIVLLGVPGLLSTLLGIGLGYWAVSSVVLSGFYLLVLVVGIVSLTVIGLLSGVAGVVNHSFNLYMERP